MPKQYDIFYCMLKSPELEKKAVLEIAALMAAAARTAPKTRGIDNIEMAAIDDEPTKNRIIETMRKISKAENRPSFERDAASIAQAPTIVVIGVRSNPAELNCGFCGYRTCDELKKTPGICAYNSVDLGIAVTSAVGVTGQFHVDNRIMYSIGRAVLDLGIFDKDVRQVLGIPISITGKNPFFDRK